MATPPSQGDTPRRGPGRPPGPRKVAPTALPQPATKQAKHRGDRELSQPAQKKRKLVSAEQPPELINSKRGIDNDQEMHQLVGSQQRLMRAQEPQEVAAPEQKIFKVQDQLDKRTEILDQIKRDSWTELVGDFPTNSLTISVLQGRGYPNLKYPPHHIDAFWCSMAIKHNHLLVNAPRQQHQKYLSDIGFSIYEQFGIKYLTHEGCEWVKFQNLWKLRVAEIDQNFGERKISEDDYAEAVETLYIELCKFLFAYTDKLLEERVNLEYKKWFATAGLTLQEEEISRDDLGRERVCVLDNEVWTVDLPKNSPFHTIQCYMEEWSSTPNQDQSVEYHSITSDWIRVSCQQSSKIFGLTPQHRGERLSLQPSINNVIDIEEEPYFPIGAPEEGEEILERLEEDNIMELDVDAPKVEDRLGPRDPNPSRMDDKRPPPLRIGATPKNNPDASALGEPADQTEASTSTQAQHNSAVVQAARCGQEMKKSSSSQPIMIAYNGRGDDDDGKTTPKSNDPLRRGQCDEQSLDETTDDEVTVPVSRVKKPAISLVPATPSSVSASNATQAPARAVSRARGGPPTRDNRARETTLRSAAMSPREPQPQPQAQSFQNRESGPIHGWFSGDTDSRETRTAKESTPQLITSTPSELTVSRPSLGQYPANVNSWQKNMVGGPEGVRQRTLEKQRLRMAPQTPAPDAPPTIVAVNHPSNSQVQPAPNSQSLVVVDGSVAQLQPSGSAASCPIANGVTKSSTRPNGDLRDDIVYIKDRNGEYTEAPQPRSQKRPASTQINPDARLFPPPPMSQTNSHPGYNGMPQYPQNQYQPPVSSITGGRMPGYSPQGYGQSSALSNRYGMAELTAAQSQVFGFSGNEYFPEINRYPNMTNGQGFPAISYNATGSQPQPSQQANQYGNLQNSYNNDGYNLAQSSPYLFQQDSMIAFGTLQPPPNQQNYTGGYPMVQQSSIYHQPQQPSVQLGYAQSGMLMQSNQAVSQQRYQSKIPQPAQQNIYDQPIISTDYIRNDGPAMATHGVSQIPQPANGQQVRSTMPTPAVVATPAGLNGTPGMANQNSAMNERLVRQSGSATTTRPNGVPSQGMYQAPLQNDSRLQSIPQSAVSTGRQPNGQSGAQIQNFQQRAGSFTGQPNGILGLHGQASHSRPCNSIRRSQVPIGSIDPRTGRVRNRVGRPSNAERRARAQAAMGGQAQPRPLSPETRQTRIFEEALERHLLSQRDYWRNGDDLVFPQGDTITQQRQLWAPGQPPLRKDTGFRQLNQNWNVLLDGSQVIDTTQQPGFAVQGRPPPTPGPYMTLGQSRLLIHASDFPDEDLFAGVDFDSNSAEDENARAESTRKAHIKLPMDSTEAFVDPPVLAAVGEANAPEVVVVAVLTPVIDDDAAEVVVAALSLAIIQGPVYVNGGGGLSIDVGYGPVAVRTGDWSAR
ncbi:hypothetical protein N431DRAFT_462206 [Stipitochalara longipes BDJ]|nr:hypothetical protein N431DRAFT_462206 [Stipitochalara longipes BDJ]